MDHWFASNELSRGLYGESACVTFRDRYTDYIACVGTHDKSAESVARFLCNLVHPSEAYEYFWTDGAHELATAASQVGAAHDSSIPGDKRQNAVAERTNGIIQDGCRALLVTAGLPIQLWVYACQYFSHCYNIQGVGDQPFRLEATLWRRL